MPNCTLGDNIQPRLCPLEKGGGVEEEALDVCPENTKGLNDKTLPMNKSVQRTGRVCQRKHKK